MPYERWKLYTVSYIREFLLSQSIDIDGPNKVDIFSVKIAETILVLLISLYNKRAKNSFYADLLTNF